jgi:glycosyltransferase involved in cell wall biosynthesis
MTAGAPGGAPSPAAGLAGTTTLLVMTLNEVRGMEVIMPRISRDWVDQILVVDGGSTDGTVEWARGNGYDVHVQRRPGIRFAYFEVFPLIRGDYIVTFSPDGNSLPEAIPALVGELRKGYDLVIGSRYLPGAGSDDDDRVTAFGNWLFTRTVNVLYGARYTDVMVMLRGYRRALVEELDLLNDEAYRLPERLFGTVISWEPLMSVRAAKGGKRIGEIPMAEPARISGERKLQLWRWGAAYYLQFWLERFVWLGRK